MHYGIPPHVPREVNKSSPVVLAGTDATIAYSPTQLPTFDGSASSWISVKSANNYTYAIKNDYTLWAWGNNNSGQRVGHQQG